MRLFILLLALLITNSVYALHEDEKEKIHLAADHADLNQQTHQGQFIGEVSLDQGTRHLRAEKAITYGNEKNKLNTAVAYGSNENLAHYWELTHKDKPPIHAYANEIHYYPLQHMIKLIGNAKVIQGDDSFSAPQIHYDTLKQHVTTVKQSNARTEIVIHTDKHKGNKL